MINGVVKATSGSGTLNNPPSSNQVAGSDFTLAECKYFHSKFL